MSHTPPLTILLLLMARVYLLLTLALSPFLLYLPPYYLPMCYMCLPSLRTLFQSLPFVPITLLMSYFLLFLSSARSIVTQGSLWFTGSLEAVSIIGRSPSPFQSSTLVLPSSVQSSFSAISMWHSHLGHPSLHIFRKFLRVLNISFLDDHLCSFSCTFCNINKSHKLPFAQSSITSSSPLDVIFSNVWTSPVSSYDGFH